MSLDSLHLPNPNVDSSDPADWIAENMNKDNEGSLQIKRRRTLLFGSEDLDVAALSSEEISSSIIGSQVRGGLLSCL